MNQSEGKKGPLRERAQKSLSEKSGGLGEISYTDIQKVMHELKVHQIELEIQNEELHLAQLELEESRNKYADLYDFAPVGYFTLDEKGIILEANLTGAALLGVERKSLIKRTLSHYIAKESHNLFYSYRRRLLEIASRQACELKMLRDNGIPFYAQLEGVAVFDSEGNFRHFRVAILDVTQRKRLEEALRRARDELELRVWERTRELVKANEKLQNEINERRLADKALRESEERYRGLFETVPVVVFGLSPDGKITSLNPAFEKKTGWSCTEWIGKPFLPLIHPDEASLAMEKFKRALQGETLTPFELHVLSRAGDCLNVEFVGTPQIKDGKVIGILGIAHDTTERKRSEETLKENLAQLSKKNRYEKIISVVTRSVHRSINLREVLENAVEAMSKNIDGADSVSIFLIEGEQAVMKSYIGFPDWFVERVKRIPYPKGATWKTIMEGKPRYCPDVDKDTVIGPAGRKLGINSYLIMPIHLEGKPVGVLNINSLKKNAFDEEELKLLEIVAQQIEIAINNAKQAEVLRESEERFRSVFEDGPIGMAIVDLNYRFTKVNKALCEMLGYTEEELTGLTFIDITHSEDVEKDVCLAERIFKGELSNYQLEKRYIKKNQEVLWINLTATAIRDRNGNALYGLAMMENISERKLMEEALREKLVQLSKKNRYETIISVVTRSVHRSINLQDVLENAVEAMSKNIEGVDNVSIYLVEGEEAVMKANRGYPDWFLERASRIPYPKGFTWKTIIDGRPRYCPDVDLDTIIGPAGREMGTKSYASMPINFEGRTVGCININSLQKSAFNEEELKLLEIVAQQIEVAINNAKQAEALRQSEELLQKANAELEMRVRERTYELYEINKNLEKEIAERRRAEEALRESFVQLSKKNRYETIISTVTRSVHQSIDLQEVFENAVESMSKNIEGVDNVSIYLIEGKEAVMRVHRGLPEWFIKRAGRIPYPKGFTWKTIIEGKPIYCPDVEQDTFIGSAGKELGTKSYLSMPIRVEGKTIGCINIHSLQKSAFDEEEIRLLEIVARQIEVAINNARQAEALRESEEKYRALYEDNPSMYFTVDTEGRILSVNRFGLEQLGYTAEELIGKSILNIFHEDDKQMVLEQFTGCLEDPGKTDYWEFRKIRKDGTVLWIREAARAVRETDGSMVILIVCEDITERKRAEEQIKESLKEKEVLLKEIQHRVKNNLQVISSLLDLQTEYFTDKKAIDIFKETHNRVRSMALIHEQLYQSKGLAKVDFAEYVRNLGTYLFQSYGVKSEAVSLKVGVDNVFLDVDTAITCGLIINELISNSLKYAFKGRKKGEIGISLHSEDNVFTMTVKDNGVGFPKHLDFRKTESLGLQLVNALTNQLGGAIRLNRGRGTEFRITFGNPKY